jgi:hydrogenase-4 component C
MLLIGILQAVVVLALAPFFSGLARVIRAKMHSRRGPSIFQNYYDIFKLLRRQEVRPACATWVFVATPFAVLAAASAIAMMIPMWTLQAPLGLAGDFIAVIYLFAMIRFFLAVAGLDSGSGFAGIGSIREMGLSALVEPVLLLVLFMFALLARSTNLGTISQVLALGRASYASPAIWLGMAAFALACFIEMGKLPFDLAEAEQELQEGPLGEYSGRSLALINWGLYAKQLLVVSLFLAVFFPFGNAATMGALPVITGMVIFLLKATCCYLIAGLLENSMARLTIYKAPRLTWLALGIALLSFVFYLAQA